MSDQFSSENPTVCCGLYFGGRCFATRNLSLSGTPSGRCNDRVTYAYIPNEIRGAFWSADSHDRLARAAVLVFRVHEGRRVTLRASTDLAACRFYGYSLFFSRALCRGV